MTLAGRFEPEEWASARPRSRSRYPSNRRRRLRFVRDDRLTADRRRTLQIERACGRPVVLFDERMTTVTANRVLKEAELSASERRQYVDKVAAAVLLQTWLDRRRGDA